MRTAARLLGVAGALAFIAGSAAAQNNNDMTLNNGDEVLFVLSDPSSGFSSGTNPPAVFDGDYFWKIYPSEALHCKDGSINAEVMWESMVDTDWSTAPDFWDRVIGNAYECGGLDLDGTPGPDCGPNCARVPDWLSVGGFDSGDILYILGDGGIPNPCTISPPLCNTTGICPLTGLLGYQVQWFGFSDPIPCDGSATSYAEVSGTSTVITPGYDGDTAITYFAPGGMVFSNPATPGSCGFGDYVFQMDYSTNETQGDCCGEGFSPYSGIGTPALGAWGAFLDPLNFGPLPHLGFDEDIINVIGDSGGGLGREQGIAGAGATNGLCLDTISGVSSIKIELRDLVTAATNPVANLALVAFGASGPIPAPGLPIFGGCLMVVPDGILSSTTQSGVVALDATIGFGSIGEGRFVGSNLTLPAFGLAPGTYFTLYGQGFVLDLSALPLITAEETQVWELRLL